MQLREYQTVAIDELRQRIREGKRSIVLVAPTGSGKTTIAAEMIRSASARGKRILFLAHRKELIEQCSARLAGINIQHGIIMGSHPNSRPWLNVHVCSVPTLDRREHIPQADLIFIDEAHRAIAESYARVMRRYPGAVFILLTATPCRLDGRGMEDIADDMVLCPAVDELTEMGHLVPTRVFAPSKPDLSGVHIERGDYKSKDLAVAIDKPSLTGSIVEHYQQLANGLQAICFAVNVQHSQHLVEEFRSAGIAAEHLDGTTPTAERTAILRRYATAQTRVVCNVQVLTEGYDDPRTGCVILARPTLSLSLFLQMVGRGLRPFPGKQHVVVLDHAGCTLKHGFVDDPRVWALDGVKKRTEKQERALSVRSCAQCWFTYRSQAGACPNCGFAPPKHDHTPDTVDGKLVEVTEAPAAYVPGKIASDPVWAYFQQEAVRLGKNGRWPWVMKELWHSGKLKRDRVPSEVLAALHQWRRGAA